MINRVRTLLMNTGRAGNDLRLPGEEYIPADYRRRELPAWLQRIYSRLFGATPDRLFINYRMRQLMQLIHATPLAEYVSQSGEDITYLPFRDELNATVFRQVLSAEAGTAYLHGQHTADEVLGQSSYSWGIRLIAEDTVRVETMLPVYVYVDLPVTFSGGLSSVIPLIPRKLTTRFSETDSGFSYTVQTTVRPATDISAVLKTAFNDAVGFDNLNLFLPELSPVQSMYHDIWLKHPHFVMRYAAACLAIANFIDAQKTAT